MIVPVIVGISGGSASGKTTLANKIQKEFGSNCSILSLDNYYKDFTKAGADIDKVNFDEPSSLDIELFIEHLNQLKKGKPVEIPKYDYRTHGRTNFTSILVPDKLILVEGLFLYNISIPNSLFNFKIYVDTSDEVRFNRRMQRDVKERKRTPESILQQYSTSVKPMYEKFVLPNKTLSDIIINGDFFIAGELKKITRAISKKLND